MYDFIIETRMQCTQYTRMLLLVCILLLKIGYLLYIVLIYFSNIVKCHLNVIELTSQA